MGPSPLPDRPIRAQGPCAGTKPVATILIIDDSDAHRNEIRRTIDACGLFDTVLEAAEGVRGLKLLLREPVDVVLCDLEMPELDGEKLLRMKGSAAQSANAPFLFLTASENMDRRSRLLEIGACDVIGKPFHPADLVARLNLQLKVKRLHDELMLKNATLATLSTVDALTGLRSRRYVTEALSVEFQRAHRYRSGLAILMADLDYFKQVNDKYGHPGGDAVLSGVGAQLLGMLRSTDVAGRYGGEELLVILTHNSLHGAEVMAERWRSGVEAAEFEIADGRRVQVTLSIGLALYRGSFENPDEMIAAADKALYRAKNSGRNRVEIYED